MKTYSYKENGKTKYVSASSKKAAAYKVSKSSSDLTICKE